MTRENNYAIEISFEKRSKRKELFKGTVPYMGSSSFSDDFEIYNDRILINANRSAALQIDNIYYNHSSSLYYQIIKSLIYYYAINREFISITNISVYRKRKNKILENKKLKASELNQVLDSSFRLNYKIEPGKLEQIFLEDQKGQGILIAVSYLLKANISKNESEKFERLWKAFNRIYTIIANDNQDFNCLKNLREFIETNPTVPKLSALKVSSLTTAKLRNSIRWRSMLLEIYDTERKIESFRDFVLRYHDKRIMEILLETKFGYREDFLRKNGFYDEVNNRIQESIAHNVVNDNELVTFLTGKYMYFVRNKTFHGERLDSTFRLYANKEDIEFRFLNNLLEPYIIDLINSNDKY